MRTATVVTALAAVSAVGYLAYFDYRRRTSPEFRRQLRKSAKLHQKAREAERESSKKQARVEIETLVRQSLQDDPLPTGLKDKEQFFVAEVARADELLTKPGGELQAALAFYRALRVYPSPVDLLNIYDRSLKEPILEALRTMIIVDPPAALTSALAGGQARVVEEMVD